MELNLLDVISTSSGSSRNPSSTELPASSIDSQFRSSSSINPSAMSIPASSLESRGDSTRISVDALAKSTAVKATAFYVDVDQVVPSATVTPTPAPRSTAPQSYTFTVDLNDDDNDSAAGRAGSANRVNSPITTSAARVPVRKRMSTPTGSSHQHQSYSSAGGSQPRTSSPIPDSPSPAKSTTSLDSNATVTIGRRDSLERTVSCSSGSSVSPQQQQPSSEVFREIRPANGSSVSGNDSGRDASAEEQASGVGACRIPSIQPRVEGISSRVQAVVSAAENLAYDCENSKPGTRQKAMPVSQEHGPPKAAPLKRNLSFVKEKRDVPPSKEELDDPELNLSREVSLQDSESHTESSVCYPTSSIATTILMADTDKVVKYVIKKKQQETPTESIEDSVVVDSDVAVKPISSLEEPKLSVTNVKKSKLKGYAGAGTPHRTTRAMELRKQKALQGTQKGTTSIPRPRMSKSAVSFKPSSTSTSTTTTTTTNTSTTASSKNSRINRLAQPNQRKQVRQSLEPAPAKRVSTLQKSRSQSQSRMRNSLGGRPDTERSRSSLGGKIVKAANENPNSRASSRASLKKSGSSSSMGLSLPGRNKNITRHRAGTATERGSHGGNAGRNRIQSETSSVAADSVSPKEINRRINELSKEFTRNLVQISAHTMGESSVGPESIYSTTTQSMTTLPSSTSYDSNFLTDQSTVLNSSLASSNNLSEYQARYEHYKQQKEAAEAQGVASPSPQIDRVSLYGIHVLTTELVRLSERVRSRVGAPQQAGDLITPDSRSGQIDTNNLLLRGVIENLYEIEAALRATDAQLVSHNSSLASSNLGPI